MGTKRRRAERAAAMELYACSTQSVNNVFSPVHILEPEPLPNWARKPRPELYTPRDTVAERKRRIKKLRRQQ